MRQVQDSVSWTSAVLVLILCITSGLSGSEYGAPILYRKIHVPEVLLADESPRFGGDVRIGDLTGDGRADFVVMRSTVGAMKPCFLGAFTMDGKVLWHSGKGGKVSARPGPVAIHDIDADGRVEVVSFFLDSPRKTAPKSMDGVVIQIRDGSTGELQRQAAPELFRQCRAGANFADWCHQRILIANFRGTKTPRDFVVKLGERVLAFDENINILWSYKIKWTKYGQHTAYIPAVGDIDGDGRDEVTGGCYLLDDDGTPKWEKLLGNHMDSVAIAEWDNGRTRAICSGFGHVVDFDGNVIVSLGKEEVPHGQEVRVADFVADSPGPEMIIRCHGHSPDVVLVANNGKILKRFKLNNFPPKNIGMEPVYWNGPDRPALLYNGGKLWAGSGKIAADLPGFPGVSFWSFCTAANIRGDDREELVIYNPADEFIYIYTPSPLKESAFKGYRAGPRQYNTRLMD